MMGVYIKRMKMPKECRECYLLEYYEYLGETQCSVTRRMLAERGKPISFDSRPGWCPLVEVTEPHGRLIEAPDVSEYEVYDEDTGAKEISLFGLMECHRMLKNAPTVIEAEGE